MHLFISLRYTAELFRFFTLIKELEGVHMNQDSKNAFNKKMPGNSQYFWKKIHRRNNKNYSRLPLSAWRY